LSGVVQTCPAGGTNWRSSSQIRQCDGGPAVSGYELPQAQQMWIGIEQPLHYQRRQTGGLGTIIAV
jgi:hypothetical protein